MPAVTVRISQAVVEMYTGVYDNCDGEKCGAAGQKAPVREQNIQSFTLRCYRNRVRKAECSR